jgi:hypothetical protein
VWFAHFAAPRRIAAERPTSVATSAGSARGGRGWVEQYWYFAVDGRDLVPFVRFDGRARVPVAFPDLRADVVAAFVLLAAMSALRVRRGA